MNPTRIQNLLDTINNDVDSLKHRIEILDTELGNFYGGANPHKRNLAKAKDDLDRAAIHLPEVF